MEELSNSEKRKTVVSELKSILKSKSLSKEIETSIYDYTIDFCTNKNIDDDMCEYIYDEKYQQLFDKINEDVKLFKKNIKNKVFKASQLAFLSPQELEPEKWKELTEKKRKKRELQQNANVTDQYTCSKCGGKKHTVIMLQTRSADEPMTQFITCTNCGFTFKQ